MEARVLARVLSLRRHLRRRERWSRAELERHQASALRELRDFATDRSSFYRRLHHGLTTRPLHELPVVTKAMLMEHFDELVTAPEIRKRDVLAYLEALQGNELFQGQYWVSSTSGSTGLRGVFMHDFDEWMTVLASYARAQDWAGVATGLTRRVRIAMVSSRVPWHGSARAAATLHSRLVNTLRLDATDPLPAMVAKLNEFQPQSLVAYASMVHILAQEQLAGRLLIAPQAIMSASEVLTDDTRRRAEAAWGSVPFNVYAATETAGVASDCERHRLHLYEDLVIVESVDEKNLPVPPGVVGAKVLVSVLFSRTQPLIRYEMSDTLALSPDTCLCGRVFALVDRVEGRQEDVLTLRSRAGGTVTVHPNVFHKALEAVPAAAWQVVQLTGGIDVRLAGLQDGFDAAALVARIRALLEEQGADPPPVAVHAVEHIEKTRLGKAPLIRRQPGP